MPPPSTKKSSAATRAGFAVPVTAAINGFIGAVPLKVSNTPPTQAYFVTYDGLPAVWYLRLTAEGSKILSGEQPNTATIAFIRGSDDVVPWKNCDSLRTTSGYCNHAT